MNQSQFSIKRVLKVTFLVIIIFMLLLVWFVKYTEIPIVHKWIGGQYFGRITLIEDHGFLIENKYFGKKEIILTNTTVVREGKTMLSAGSLAVGERVFVIGQEDNTGVVTAEMVRIFPQKIMSNK